MGRTQEGETTGEMTVVAAAGRPIQEAPPAAEAVDLSQAVEDLTARMKAMGLRQQAHFVEEVCRMMANNNTRVNVRRRREYGEPLSTESLEERPN